MNYKGCGARMGIHRDELPEIADLTEGGDRVVAGVAEFTTRR